MICMPCGVTIWQRAVWRRQTWSLSVRRRPKTLTLTLKFLWASINTNGRLSILSHFPSPELLQSYCQRSRCSSVPSDLGHWNALFRLLLMPFSFGCFSFAKQIIYSTICDEEGFQQIYFAVSRELWSIRTELPSFWDIVMMLAPGVSMWASLFLFWEWHF